MTAIKCPNCGLDNSADENYCVNCGTSILSLKPPIYAPVAEPQPIQPYQSYAPFVPTGFDAARYDNQNALGGKVYVGYKIFCGLAALACLLPVVLGIMAIAGSTMEKNAKEANDAVNGGIMFMILGIIFFVPYVLGLLLPRRPFHWIFGIVLLILSLVPLGMSSCLIIPAAIALLIFWFRPETKAYFGRN